jgi:hypothetical protein
MFMGKIISGIICMIAGLSEHFVLIGTNSSTALVGFGVIMVIVGLVQLAGKKGTGTPETPKE